MNGLVEEIGEKVKKLEELGYEVEYEIDTEKGYVQIDVMHSGVSGGKMTERVRIDDDGKVKFSMVDMVASGHMKLRPRSER